MAADPFAQFEDWFSGVLEVDLYEANTFILATADPDGMPSARALLMKDFSPEGLVFYTGLDSRKSRAMIANPRAAATFVWVQLHRQVRFEGAVEQVSDEEADAYFVTRPRGAQLAAHASRQSEPVSGRDQLDERFEEVSTSFGDVVPRPGHWGGWRLRPQVVEFWQGRPNRFHDRIRYLLVDEGWKKERLSP
ncbi:MAG TPA: pyridoxamine 5'-phosphate oxidase [Acidimicrobiia bacterium]|nr:pyridoxamine 5'-phosphate oxidase [Acidimicrobiia bacterium]